MRISFAPSPSRNVGEGVVDRISLSPTGFEIIGLLVHGFAQHKFRALLRHPVMSSLAHDPISRTGNRHVRGLECCVVSSRKSPIRRKAGDGRVCEVASDERPQVVQFLLGRSCVSGLPYGGGEMVTRFDFLPELLK